MRNIDVVKEELRNEILKKYDLDAMAKKRAELKAAGTISDNLENLSCKLHEDCTLRAISDKFSAMQYAACEPCLKSRENWEVDGMGERVKQLLAGKLLRPSESDYITKLFNGTAAYRCEQPIGEKITYEHFGVKLGECGWVLGRPRKDVDIVSEEMEPGVHVPVRHFGYVNKFYCGVCGVHLGTYDPSPKIRY